MEKRALTEALTQLLKVAGVSVNDSKTQSTTDIRMWVDRHYEPLVVLSHTQATAAKMHENDPAFLRRSLFLPSVFGPFGKNSLAASVKSMSKSAEKEQKLFSQIRKSNWDHLFELEDDELRDLFGATRAFAVNGLLMLEFECPMTEMDYDGRTTN